MQTTKRNLIVINFLMKLESETIPKPKGLPYLIFTLIILINDPLRAAKTNTVALPANISNYHWERNGNCSTQET